MAGSGGSSGQPGWSSRLVPAIYFSMDVGISLSGNNRPRSTSFHYTSRNMQENMYRRQEEAYQRDRQLAIALSRQEADRYLQRGDNQGERQRRLGVRSLEQHERSSSAPPSLRDGENVGEPFLRPSSPQQGAAEYQSTPNSRNFPSTPTNRPLPAAARFRLGGEDLPWSLPQWPEPGTETPNSTSPSPRAHESPPRRAPRRPATARPASSTGSETYPKQVQNRRELDSEAEAEMTEDPQRVRELEQLHNAMMTVDSLHHDAWDTWTWEDGVGDLPRGPRGLGWAVRSNSDVTGNRSYTPPPPAPPTYVESQWEQIARRMAGAG